MYKPTSLLLRRVNIQQQTFTLQQLSVQLPQYVEMDTAGAWFPNPVNTPALQEAIFDNCDVKKLVSVHMYLKDVRVTYTIKDSSEVRQSDPSPLPVDGYIYVYANKYNTTKTWPNIASFLKLAKRHRFQRGYIPYIPLISTPLYARRSDTRSFSTVAGTTFKDYCRTVDTYDFAGGHGVSGATSCNLDWWFMLPSIAPWKPPTGEEYNTQISLSYEIVVATKWNCVGVAY